MNMDSLLKHKHKSVLAIFIALAVVSVDCNSEGDILQSWRAKLVDTNNVLESWDPTLVNPCTWFHVSCNSDNRVTRVDLGNAGIIGPLIPQLGNLAFLQYLELYENQINGSIPSEIGKIRGLISFDLYNNNLRGPIPPTFGNLTSLKFLRVANNRLTGSIPSSLGNLRSLQIIDLSSNRLSGNIPIQILSLVRYGKLETLNVSKNMLAGTVRHNSTVTTTIIQDPKVWRR